MFKSLSALILTIFAAGTLQAQTATQTSVSEMKVPEKSPWGFQVDLNFMRFDGSYGFGVGYDLLEKLSTELSFTHTNFNNKSYGFYSVTSDTTANAYGLRLNYYPFSNVKEGGFYTSAVVSQVELNSTIKGESMITKTTPTTKDLSDSHIGHQIFMGYHFAPKKTDGLKLTSRIGVGSGTGKDYGIREGWNEYEISEAMLLDATFLFSY